MRAVLAVGPLTDLRAAHYERLSPGSRGQSESRAQLPGWGSERLSPCGVDYHLSASTECWTSEKTPQDGSSRAKAILDSQRDRVMKIFI